MYFNNYSALTAARNWVEGEEAAAAGM